MAYDTFKNVFVADNGDLIRKRDCAVVRKQYSFTFSKSRDSQQLRATIRRGGFVWPGGYPLYLINKDGDCICFKCAKENYKSLSRDLLHNGSLHTDVNFENNDLICDYCNNQIEPAYTND
jgi:hypothetical protein